MPNSEAIIAELNEAGVNSSGLKFVRERLERLNNGIQPDFTRRLGVVLEKEDHVGLSFWLAAGLQLAATAFFFFQVFLVPRRWANSMIVCGLITGVAWHHYMYMKDIWAETSRAPTVYRYMDWLITVPLQVIEFYLVLAAANPAEKPPISMWLFYRLLISSTAMLIFGYLGETEMIPTWWGFAGGMTMWLYIIYEVFIGEASIISGRLSLDEAKKFLARISGKGDEEDDDSGDTTKNAIQKALNNSGKSSANAAYAVALKEFKKPEAQLAFEILRVIILLGWALYPAGYVAGNTADSQTNEDTLNAIYNVADLINKVAFGLAIYFAAGSQMEKEKEIMLTCKLPSIDELLARRATSLNLVGRSLQDKLVAAHGKDAPIVQTADLMNIFENGGQSNEIQNTINAQGPIIPSNIANKCLPTAPLVLPNYMLTGPMTLNNNLLNTELDNNNDATKKDKTNAEKEADKTNQTIPPGGFN